MDKLLLSGFKTNLGLLGLGVIGILEAFGVSVSGVVHIIDWITIAVGAIHKVLKDTGVVKA